MGCVYSLLYLQLGYEGELGMWELWRQKSEWGQTEITGKASVNSCPQASPETIVMKWLSGSLP